MRISDWSSDVCSSDLAAVPDQRHKAKKHQATNAVQAMGADFIMSRVLLGARPPIGAPGSQPFIDQRRAGRNWTLGQPGSAKGTAVPPAVARPGPLAIRPRRSAARSGGKECAGSVSYQWI